MSRVARRGRWRRALRWLPLAGLAAASAALILSGAHHAISLDRLLASRAWLAAAVAEDAPRAALVAYLVYVASVVLSIPVSPFLTMICGFLFGIAPGAAIAVAAATTGATIVFSIGRGAAADFLRARAGPRLSGLAAGFRRDAFGYIVFLRLLPIFPFWLTNLAPAAFGVSRRTFVLATVLGMAPGAVVYALTGSAIEGVVAAHETGKATCLAAGGSDCDDALTLRDLVTPGMIAGLGALGVLALLSVALRRWRDRRAAAITGL